MERATRRFDASIELATTSTHPHFQTNFGAGDEGRTRDNQLGKLGLYQLSYTRSQHECYQFEVLASITEEKNLPNDPFMHDFISSTGSRLVLKADCKGFPVEVWWHLERCLRSMRCCLPRISMPDTGFDRQV